MKLALIGSGAMGQLVATQARAGGDVIGAMLTSRDEVRTIDELAESLRGHEAAIEFSVGTAVLRNAEACARAGVPVVEGTTGWKEHEADVKRLFEVHDTALVYGANFS